MQFLKYQHVVRLGTKGTKKINEGECHVFPKLDGTNGQLWVDNGELKAGSRNRMLSLDPDGDNAGFYKWVLSQDVYLPFFRDHPNHRLYGEFLVKHTIKHYRPECMRKFYVFDVLDEKSNYIPYDTYSTLLDKYNITYIPRLARITNPTSTQITAVCKTDTYLLEPGTVGEGVVVKNYDYATKYNTIIWGKVIRDEFKMDGVEKKNQVVCFTPEEHIVEKYHTNHFIDKEFAKFTLNNEWDMKNMGKLLVHIQKTLIHEQAENIMFEYKKCKQLNMNELFKLARNKSRARIIHLMSQLE